MKAPHGIYRCREEDTWIAISVETDFEWNAFKKMVRRPEWDAPEFSDASGRLTNVARLDLLVEQWTASIELHDCFSKLQSIGIAAGPVLRADQLLDNEQLVERGFVVTTDHPVVGTRRQFGLPWRMDSLVVEYQRAPLLGEHTREILGNILGIDDAAYAKLQADGVLT
jgi:crotonobetainyl-CoA:carnitine CoA-transferase CaiB-like acyl-CoA transferase